MFGMSVFQSVLERLKAEEAPDQDGDAGEVRANARITGLNSGFVAPMSVTGFAEAQDVTRAYFEMAGDDMLAPPQPLPRPVMPSHLRRTQPEEIVADLAFGEAETLTGLAEKRRNFAAANHPDRHHPDFRANATIRMKIANMLIDEAMRRLKRR